MKGAERSMGKEGGGRKAIRSAATFTSLSPIRELGQRSFNVYLLQLRERKGTDTVVSPLDNGIIV